MRVTIDLMKKSTQIIDLSNVINPRVGDDDLQLPLHICYGDNLFDMRGKDVEFLSNDPNKKNIYIAGTCNTNTPGDNLYMGDLTFRFPAGTFQADGTYDPDKTMFRIVDKETQKVISSVNVKITVMKNAIEFNFDPDKSSYDSRLENMLHDFHDKGQAMLDEIKGLNDQAKSNVSGDTAETAKQAKQQANQNAGDISDLKGEVAGARGRFDNMAGREDAQDEAINQKESIVNANANYTALQKKDAQQDTIIANKANQDFIVNYLSRMNFEPEAFENEAGLKAKYPNGNPGIMVTVDTGHKWIWFNNRWNDCGEYQSASIWGKNVTIVNADDLKPPYDDANEYPANSTVTIAVDPSLIRNIPQQTSFTMITMSANKDLTGAVQFFIPQSGKNAYYRIAWQLPHIYTRWISLNSDGNNTQVFTSKLNDSNKDLSKLPANSTITYAVDDNSKLVGVPDTVDCPFTITTQTSSNEGLGGAYQLLITQDLSIFMRLAWGDPPTFSEWISIGRNSFNKQIFNGNLTDAYQNLNKLKVNTTVTYDCDPSKLANLPAGESSAFTIRTINAIDDNAAGAVQLLFSQSGKAYWRLGWGVPAFYDKWKKFYPIDAPQSVTNSTINPSLAMFPTFTVIGDSYTCGTTDFDNNWKGSSKISWPQIMAREHGMSYKDSYSKSGATVTSFLQEHESTFNSDEIQDLYIVELGINDAIYYQNHPEYLGSLDETDNDKADHFYWYYAHIIKMIKAKVPNAKIICLGVTDGYNSGSNFTTITKAIQDIAGKYGIPFVDIAQHPLFKSDFYTTHMVGGHPTGPVYAAMADAYTKLIQNCIVNNYDYFERYGAE